MVEKFLSGMKNKNENSLEFATGFAKSIRGKFILGQALHYAIIELEKKDNPLREVSNISDMKLLRDFLYPMFSASVEATEKFKSKV